MHTLLLQKLVHGSTFFAWIIHESEDGTKHVFTLLVVEMVRGIKYIYIYIPTPSHTTEGLRLELLGIWPDPASSYFSCFIWFLSYPIFKDSPPELQMLAFLGNPTYRSKAPSSNFHPSNSLDICWDVARLNIMKQPVEWVQRYSKICSKVKAAWKRLRHWIDMDWFQGKSAGKRCVFTYFYHQIYIFIYSFPAFTNPIIQWDDFGRF